MKIFMWIVGAVTAIVKFLDLRLRWQAKNEGKKKEAERLKRLERIDDVIARGDEKGMNDLLEDQRKRYKAKETGSVRPAVLASALSVFLLALPLSGCISTTAEFGQLTVYFKSEDPVGFMFDNEFIANTFPDVDDQDWMSGNSSGPVIWELKFKSPPGSSSWYYMGATNYPD